MFCAAVFIMHLVKRLTLLPLIGKIRKISYINYSNNGRKYNVSKTISYYEQKADL